MKDIIDEDNILGGATDKDILLDNLTKKLGELNEFLQDSANNRWGDNVIDIAMDIIKDQREEILKLEHVIKSMKSEIGYSIDFNKSDEVRQVYLDNAIRYADDMIYVD